MFFSREKTDRRIFIFDKRLFLIYFCALAYVSVNVMCNVVVVVIVVVVVVAIVVVVVAVVLCCFRLKF